MPWSVKNGTHPKFPSVRVDMDGFPTTRKRTEFRQIQLVFRNGENVGDMRKAIQEAVTEYIRVNPRDGSPRVTLPQGLLNLTGNE